MGLVPHIAGYQIEPIEVGKEQEDYHYKVSSSIPNQWVGELTAVCKTNLNQKYQQKNLNL